MHIHFCWAWNDWVSSTLTGAAAQPSAPQPQCLSPRSSRQRCQHLVVSVVSILAVEMVAWYCGFRKICISLPLRETRTETSLSLAGSLPNAYSSQAWAGPELGAGSWSQGFHGWQEPGSLIIIPASQGVRSREAGPGSRSWVLNPCTLNGTLGSELPT